MEKSCSVEGCGRPHESNGFCAMHAKRWRKHGDPLAIGQPKPYEGRTRAQTEALLMRRRSITARGCWDYTGAVSRQGYGQIGYQGRTWGAHRLAYTLWVGPIPDGMMVCHHCDNRRCINPEHLFTGTAADNNADMDRKGRARRVIDGTPQPTYQQRARGERNGGAKLTEPEVLEIRGRAGRHADIAADYGVSKSTVTAIKSGRLWRHLLD